MKHIIPYIAGGLVAWGLLFFFQTKPETVIVGRTIELTSDSPAETLKLAGKPYAVRDTVWRDSIHFIIAKDSSFIDTLIDRTRPFGTKGQTRFYRWNITANPMQRTFDPFIIDGLPQTVDTTFNDTLQIVNTDPNWYIYLASGGLFILLIEFIAGLF